MNRPALIFLVSVLLPFPSFAAFTDVTGQARLGGGSQVAWGDYDNDGWDDLMVDGRRLFRNEGDGNFTEVTTDAHLDQIPGPISAGNWADWDNDGWLDFATVNGQGSTTKTSLDYVLHNEGDGTFTWIDAITDGWGSAALGWGDYDNDGLLDLYVCASEVDFDGPDPYRPDHLFWNRGDGRFLDRTYEAHMAGMAPLYGRSVCWGDYDQDGDQDCMVGNYRLHPNFLWGNDGGVFKDIGQETGVAGIPSRSGTADYYGHTIGCAWGDFTNDGLLDLAVVNLAHPGSYLDFSDITMLYVNNGPPDYNFTLWDAAHSGITWYETHSSPAWADYDQDGYLDLFITSIYPNRPAFLYRNNGDLTFTNVAAQEGIDVRNSWGCAWSDYDQDGDSDLVVAADGVIRLLRNDAAAGNWLQVKLTGVDSNRMAVGAQVEVRAGELHMVRQVEAGMGTCSSQNSATLHFGLGNHTQADLTIRWPSGLVDQDMNVAVNQLLEELEGGGVGRGSLEGTVRDADTGAPIAGARFALDRNANGRKRVAITDSQGFYRFEDLPVGVIISYHLEADHYFPEWTDWGGEVYAGQTTYLDRTMKHAAPLSGDYTIDYMGGDFPSLLEAVNALEIAGVQGPTTFIHAPFLSILGGVRIGPIEGSEAYPVLFRSGELGAAWNFQPDDWQTECIRFDGCRNVTIDGGERRNLFMILAGPVSSGRTTHLVRFTSGSGTIGNSLTRCQLDGNDPQHHPGFGVLVEAAGTTVGNNLIGNFFKGVVVQAASATRISGNIIGRENPITSTAIYSNGVSATIEANWIRGLRSIPSEPNLTGIYLWNDRNATVVNNMIFDLNDTAHSAVVRGMRILNSSYVRLYNNTVALSGDEGRRGSQGIYFEEKSKGEAINNLVYNLRDGDGEDIALQVRSADLNFNHHNFLSGTDLDAKGFTPGESTLTGDPRLVGMTDPHLRASSPCIGAGYFLDVVGYDIDGSARYVPPSIGADEYIGPPPAPPRILLGGYMNTSVTSSAGGIVTLLALLSDPEEFAEGLEVMVDGQPSGILLRDDGSQGDFEPGDGLYGLRFRVDAGSVPPLRFLAEIGAQGAQAPARSLWPLLNVE